MNTFRVIEQKWNTKGKSRKTIFETTSLTEAMDYARTVKEPLKMRNMWELVAEGGFDDGVNADKIERTFEYENTKTGEIIEYKYYIEAINGSYKMRGLTKLLVFFSKKEY